MRILSPDSINEIKEDHTGLYFTALIVGAALFFFILLTFGVLKLLIEMAIKHYYYALGIVAILLYFKINKRKKKADNRMGVLNEHPNR